MSDCEQDDNPFIDALEQIKTEAPEKVSRAYDGDYAAATDIRVLLVGMTDVTPQSEALEKFIQTEFGALDDLEIHPVQDADEEIDPFTDSGDWGGCRCHKCGAYSYLDSQYAAKDSPNFCSACGNQLVPDELLKLTDRTPTRLRDVAETHS